MKKNIAIGLITLLALQLSVVPLYAQSNNNNSNRNKSNNRNNNRNNDNRNNSNRNDNNRGGGGNFCEHVDTLTAPVLKKVQNSRTKRQSNRSKRVSKQTQNRKNFDRKVISQREKTDKELARRYERLTTRAQTEDAKLAVSTFKNTVSQALATKRAAVDAARAAFRNGVAQAVDGRSGQIDTAFTTYQTSVITVIEKAKTDCAANVLPATVRKTFQDSVKAARVEFKTGASGAEKMKTAVSNLRLTRKAAITKAQNEFSLTVSNAAKNLKTAIGTSNLPQ